MSRIRPCLLSSKIGNGCYFFRVSDQLGKKELLSNEEMFDSYVHTEEDKSEDRSEELKVEGQRDSNVDKKEATSEATDSIRPTV